MHGELVYDVYRAVRDTQGYASATLRKLQMRSRYSARLFLFVEAGKMLGIVTKFDFLQAFAFTTSHVVPHFDALMGRTVAERR